MKPSACIHINLIQLFSVTYPCPTFHIKLCRIKHARIEAHSTRTRIAYQNQIVVVDFQLVWIMPFVVSSLRRMFLCSNKPLRILPAQFTCGCKYTESIVHNTFYPGTGLSVEIPNRIRANMH